MIDSTFQVLLQKLSIREYLENAGIYPSKELSGGKFSYRCPFPDHQETKPSFMLYTNDEYENFHCFGCGRGWNIVHLVSGIENISYKDALKKLGAKFDLNIEESLMSTIDLVIKQGLTINKDQLSMDQALLSISNLCRFYLESVSFDSKETEIIDSVYHEIDNHIYNYEYDGIYDILNSLPLCFKKRKDLIKKKKEQHGSTTCQP